jgi:NADH:ubiquinone oxidoreductase subunit H
MNSLWPDLVVSLVFITYAIVMLLSFGGLLTWVERKQSAVMADRIGANRPTSASPSPTSSWCGWGCSTAWRTA